MYLIEYVQNHQKFSVDGLFFADVVWFIVGLEHQGYNEFQVYDEDNHLVMEEYCDEDDD